jgi:competence protein ComEA
VGDSLGARLRLVFIGVFSAALVFGAFELIARRPAGRPVELGPPPLTATPAELRVYVAGEVGRPGVVTLPQGSIVQDAIDAAGGLSENADPGRLNLAARLTDGQQIVVPGAGEPDAAPEAGGLSALAAPQGPEGKVNLNTASAEELEALPGIGPVTAAAIVEYRTTHGSFATIEAIMDVPGIGPKTLQASEDLIEI